MKERPKLKHPSTIEEWKQAQTALAALGGIVLTWNQIENLLASLICLTVDRDQLRGSTAILTMELSILSRVEMLKMFHAVRPSVSPHVSYISKAIDRFRIYRNYYVHGTNHVAKIDGTKSVVLSMRDNKFNEKGIGFLESYVDESEMLELLKGIEDFRDYLRQFIRILELNDFTREAEQLVTLQKASLPPKPTKHLRFLGRDQYHDPT